MPGLASLGLAGLATPGLVLPETVLPGIGAASAATVATVAALATVGVLGLFGGSDDGDGDLSGIARRLDAREDPKSIERELDALEEAVDALVADADLDRHLRDAPQPDASAVEKAEALSRAVRRDQLSVGPGGTPGGTDTADGAAANAATRLRREQSPSSPAGRRLLDALASPERADDLDGVLTDAAAALDTQQALDRAVAEVSDSDGVAPGDVRRIREELDHLDSETASAVVGLAEAAAERRSSADRRESERDQIGEATDALTAAATGATDVDVGPDSGRPVAERLGVLADAVERDELVFTDGEASGGQASSVAGEVRRERRPESAVAKRLLDRLASPGMGDLRAALETAVDQLDAASTTQSVVADLDQDAVEELADDVAADLDGRSGPVADAVEDRIADLREMLDRADESNAVVPYAVRSELRFYDSTLLSQLDAVGGRAAAGSGASADGAAMEASGSAKGVGERREAVADRREEVEDRYVDGRRDHNHSIPLHFLSLVDALLDDAEGAAAGGDDARAAGMVAAADETLDYVENLYERNEYSVMLRRLRG
ncbi:coiled-coil domain-containing protein [Halorussus litoreus]|uniref:hypothetical protein n=1 Tax=Halorussus litoreus TaxID=1710536 RepID=UPI000E25E267|nr:hypothetical protein [Halorussus litoreus]